MIVFSEICLNLFLSLPSHDWKTPQTTKFAISAAGRLEADVILAVWIGRNRRGSPLGAGKS